MQIKNSQFNEIIENIPSIEVQLEWFDKNGQGNYDKELEINSYILRTNFSCYESAFFDAGDCITPPCFTSNGLEVSEIEANIFDNEGEAIELSIEQKEKLSKEIKLSIISN